MDNEVFVFERCEVRVATRELLFEGVARALEPRPFELLVYLIRHRARVVSKDELLDQLWPFDLVTASVLARAVMKIRKAIGDDGDAGTLIKTVHRTGYRFIGAVRELAPQPPSSPVLPPALPPVPQAVPQPGPLPLPAPAAPPWPAPAAGAGSLVLLPFENRTGRTSLDWLELGLMSLVVRDLGANPRLSVVSIAAVLNALQAMTGGPVPEDRLSAVMRLLGAHHGVQVAVSGEEGAFVLHATLSGEDGTTATVLTGSELTDLGCGLTHWLESHFFPGDLAPAPHAGLEATDGALARAMQALAQQKWTLGLELLEPVLRAAPTHLGALLEKLRALVALDDDAAFELGDWLLARLHAAPNQAIEAAVHLELAQIHVRRRMNAKAKHHLDEALHSAPGQAARESVIATTLLRASIAVNEFDFTVAAALVERAEALCGERRSVFDQLAILSLRLVLEAESGSMVQAWAYAKRAVALYRDHGLLMGQARAECNLANASASLGQFRLAEQHGEAGLAISRSLAMRTDTTISALLLCGLYRQRRKPVSLARVLAILDEANVGDGPRNHGFRLMSRAQSALAQARHAEAAAILAEAVAEAEAHGHQMQLHFSLPLLTGALIHAGDTAGAEQACARIAALAKLERDRNLRGALLHSQAQLAHARGEVDQAIGLLVQARDVTPLGWWNAHARIDGAWLALERDRLDLAKGLVRGLDSWLEEHPAGLALQARLHHAEGHIEPARAAHARLAAAIEGPLPVYLQDLGRLYDAQRPLAPPVPLPPIPCVPTWLP